mmetsp:Transcript_3364/g.11833  ORF Transcript_3364/g.11833 Transcript_3364/m.11833 type:complete len:144 (-) Transcript_3364:94-525(-)
MPADELGKRTTRENVAVRLPKGVCVKVSLLRPKYDNLEEWCAVPGHALVLRAGRVFITDKKTKEKRVYTYSKSEWHNPFTLKEYSLAESLKRFEEHLQEMLKDDSTKERFLALQKMTELGCFCPPGSKCHREVIIKVLRSVLE